MEKKNKLPSHSNNDNKRHKDVSFNRNRKINMTKEELQKQKEKVQFEKEKKKLELLLEKRIEEASKQEEKQKQRLKKNKTRKDKVDSSISQDTSVIPTISLKEFVHDKNNKKKESFFQRWKRKREEKRKQKELSKQKIANKKEESAKIKEKKLEKARLAKEEKIRRQNELKEEKKKAKELENERKVLLNNEEKRLAKEKLKEEKLRKEEEKKLLLDKKKQEKLKLKEEQTAKRKAKKLENERVKAEKEEKARLVKEEKIRKQNELREEKEAEKRRKELEKERIRQEKELLNTKVDNFDGFVSDKQTPKINENKLRKEEEKRLAKEKKEAERLKKEEERKAKLKEKFEEETRKKKEKEEKEILLITKRREKLKKQKEEREQSRRERKEKAILIKKAQEESRQKERRERKTFKERVNDWYNNLSFVKDRQNRRELQRQTLLIDFDGADAVRSDEKIVYKYVAKNSETGKVETGMFAAFSKLDVHSFLLAEGYEVYEITPQKSISRPIPFLGPRIKFKASELDFFLTQLSTFLKSGITLVESVKILSKQTKKQHQRNIYKSIIYELTMGENFSEALAKQGNVFPRLLVNMVKTSELTGDLPETLDDMANYYRETEKTKKQMISAITYPAVVLIFAFVILIFIMVSVIPQFVSIYNDMETGLPAITVGVINLSNFLQANWILLVIGLIIFIITFIVLFKTIKVFRSVVQSLFMNIPIIGKIIIYNEVTMFTKTFASLLNHNVYITDCMEVLSKITNNEVYKMMIFDTITNLAKGEAISNSFKNHWAFPTIAYEMILTGERTGQLGTMMDKVANYYQEQHKNAVGQIKAFIEPVMIIILAAIVGVVLLSVVLPMFDMYENIGMA